MKRYLIGCICLLGCLLDTSAQNRGIGTWQTYLSNREGIAGATKDGLIYTITQGGMFAYNPVDSSISTFSTIEGLSNIDLTTIYHAPTTNRIYLGFEDGMVNFFEDPTDITQLSDIERNVNFTDKRINDFYEDGNLLYIATNFGLVVFDQTLNLPLTDATQFADNPSRIPVQSIAVDDTHIYIELETGRLYRADKNSPILRDPQIWQEADYTLSLPDTLTVRDLEANEQNVYILTDIGIFELENDQWVEHPIRGNWDQIHVGPQSVAVSRFEFVRMLNENGELINYFIAELVNDVVLTGTKQTYNITPRDGMVYFDDQALTPIIPDGPKSNDLVRVAADKGKLYIAAGGYDQTFVPTGSSRGIYAYNGNTQIWKIFDRFNGSLPDPFSAGFARLYVDPTQQDRIWVGSWGQGIGYIENDSLMRYFNCGDGLPGIADDCGPDNNADSRVSGMGLDPFGNMWVALDFASPPLAVIKPDGTIASVPSSRFPANDHIVDMVVDDFGSCWMVNRNQGLLVYTNNDNTPDNLTDGRLLTIRNGAGLTELSTNLVFDLAKDRDGAIWVGTADGIGVFYDPFTISTGEIIEASKPAVGQQFTLNNLTVLAIAIDGGNRKWVGTDEGVLLFSENADEVLEIFTEDNSPLLSNRILDIAVDDETGEVFFATEKGLISYQSDATGPRPVCDEVFVFPNPVMEADNRIVIQGTTEGAVVKITTPSGMLVREIEAQGGTAVWDGNDNRGIRVTSGTYLALIAENDGTNPCIGKFTVINP